MLHFLDTCICILNFWTIRSQVRLWGPLLAGQACLVARKLFENRVWELDLQDKLARDLAELLASGCFPSGGAEHRRFEPGGPLASSASGESVPRSGWTPNAVTSPPSLRSRRAADAGALCGRCPSGAASFWLRRGRGDRERPRPPEG